MGYTVGLSRAFRYLAFTSDFGEALRPVVSPKAVNASYAVAGGYCVVDVAWEAYKLKKRNNRTESGEYMTMTQLIIERSAFQALASIALPFLLIHTTVDITKKVCNKVGRFQKWGPSLAGFVFQFKIFKKSKNVFLNFKIFRSSCDSSTSHVFG